MGIKCIKKSGSNKQRQQQQQKPQLKNKLNRVVITFPLLTLAGVFPLARVDLATHSADAATAADNMICVLCTCHCSAYCHAVSQDRIFRPKTNHKQILQTIDLCRLEIRDTRRNGRTGERPDKMGWTGTRSSTCIPSSIRPLSIIAVILTHLLFVQISLIGGK